MKLQKKDLKSVKNQVCNNDWFDTVVTQWVWLYAQFSSDSRDQARFQIFSQINKQIKNNDSSRK